MFEKKTDNLQKPTYYQVKARLIEIFVKPIPYYDLSTIVLGASENNRLKALLSTELRLTFEYALLEP